MTRFIERILSNTAAPHAGRSDAEFCSEVAALRAVALAPKPRGWRSAFLRRRVASVDLVEASSALRLSDHVGKRVAATGGLVDREMHVRSLAILERVQLM
jgi:hypothetical protein